MRAPQQAPAAHASGVTTHPTAFCLVLGVFPERAWEVWGRTLYRSWSTFYCFLLVRLLCTVVCVVWSLAPIEAEKTNKKPLKIYCSHDDCEANLSMDTVYCRSVTLYY